MGYLLSLDSKRHLLLQDTSSLYDNDTAVGDVALAGRGLMSPDVFSSSHGNNTADAFQFSCTKLVRICTFAKQKLHHKRKQI